MSDEKRRRFELELTIDAPPEAVWNALTDAAELTRWFPLDARVEPGVGGKVWLSWGKGLEGSSEISIWEPGVRLRTVESAERPWSAEEDARDPGGPREIAVDYHLQGRQGQTVLRLVHSGFGRGADWDDEFDSISNGWKFELRSLRHYLMHHRGRERRVGLVRRRLALGSEHAMQRILGVEGLASSGRVLGLGEGDGYEATDVFGIARRGRIVVPAGPAQFAATVADQDDALLRVMCERLGGHLELWLWLSDWGADAGRVERFARRWSTRLDVLFGRDEA